MNKKDITCYFNFVTFWRWYVTFKNVLLLGFRMVERSPKEELFWISCISPVIAVCPSPSGGSTEGVSMTFCFKDVF
jgi:hypothetical protein